jgi:hypothetical protein
MISLPSLEVASACGRSDQPQTRAPNPASDRPPNDKSVKPILAYPESGLSSAGNQPGSPKRSEGGCGVPQVWVFAAAAVAQRDPRRWSSGLVVALGSCSTVLVCLRSGAVWTFRDCWRWRSSWEWCSCPCFSREVVVVPGRIQTLARTAVPHTVRRGVGPHPLRRGAVLRSMMPNRRERVFGITAGWRTAFPLGIGGRRESPSTHRCGHPDGANPCGHEVADERFGCPCCRHPEARAPELRREHIPQPVQQELLGLADIHPSLMLVEQTSRTEPLDRSVHAASRNRRLICEGAHRPMSRRVYQLEQQHDVFAFEQAAQTRHGGLAAARHTDSHDA